MLEIRINGTPLDLPGSFGVDMEETSPIFNDCGTRTIPATVPPTPKNNRLLSFATRIDTATDPNSPEIVATFADGAYIRRGLVNVISAGRSEGITFNVGFDNSTAYAKWNDRKLSELTTLPVVTGKSVGLWNGVDGVLQYVSDLYQHASPQVDPLAVFPVAVAKESDSNTDNPTYYWELLNVAGAGAPLLKTPGVVKRIIDGTLTTVTVPEGYGVSPFVRVWQVLELIFADLGLTIDGNIFKTDPELARVVVLNNAADALCVGEIRYSDLMPDCTVAEFLQALWVRFGMVYAIDYDTKQTTLRLVRDIIREGAQLDLTTLATAPEMLSYPTKQYLKLSAKTSLEGAAPATDRFEDFIKGLDFRHVHTGADVADWTYISDDNGGRWSGDVGVSSGEWNPGTDDDDQTGAEVQPDPAETFVAREFVTGAWFKLDAANRSMTEASSPFFNWDPAPDDYEACELSSADECVPMVRVDTGETGTGNPFAGLCPGYLTGARHYHSYVKGSGSKRETGVNTPLAFAVAYTFGDKTIGRISPEGDDGQPLTMPDGSHPELSLLFQFQNGLFARFWTGYDEILRHGNCTVEVTTALPKPTVRAIDMLAPVALRGVRCLLDKYSYSLPATHTVATKMTLRTITTKGMYDIKAEQNVPDFTPAARRLAWFLKSDGYDPGVIELEQYKQAAIEKARTQFGYQPHHYGDEYWDLGLEGVEVVSIERAPLKWQNDLSLPTPKGEANEITRTYKAILAYYLYEVCYADEEGSGEPIIDENMLYRVEVEADYQVVLVARWVNN